MKKELFAGILLTTMITASLFNTYYLTKVTESIASGVNNAISYAEQDNWDSAKKQVKDSENELDRHKTYFKTVLEHEKVSSIEGLYSDFSAHIYSSDKTDTVFAGYRLLDYLDYICSSENISFSSIF